MSDTSESREKIIALDVESDKALIEDHIVDHIHERMPKVDRNEIENAVDGIYERLLNQARVKLHIPTLVEHAAAEEVRQQHKDD